MSRRFYSQQARRFTRRWWLGGLRTLLWVSLITVLIWMYADMEFTREREFRVTLRLTTGGSEGLVIISDRKVLPRKDEEVVFKAAGSSTGLDALEGRLKSAGSVIECDLSSMGPQEAVLSVADIISKKIEPGKDGLTMAGAAPSVVPVTLDERITVSDVPVDFEYAGAELAAPPVKTPPTASIRVARSQWEPLKGRNPSLKTVPVNLQKVDVSREIIAEISPFIGDVQVAPEPLRISVRLQVKELTEDRAVKISVQVMLPPTWLEDDTWKRYALVRKDPADWTKMEITVSGSKDELAKLKPENVEACLILNDSDKKPLGSWLSREISIRLPENPQLKIVGERPKVFFRLDPIPAAP